MGLAHKTSNMAGTFIALTTATANTVYLVGTTTGVPVGNLIEFYVAADGYTPTGAYPIATDSNLTYVSSFAFSVAAGRFNGGTITAPSTTGGNYYCVVIACYNVTSGNKGSETQIGLFYLTHVQAGDGNTIPPGQAYANTSIAAIGSKNGNHSVLGLNTWAGQNLPGAFLSDI
jgi:hypothetical protein